MKIFAHLLLFIIIFIIFIYVCSVLLFIYV